MFDPSENLLNHLRDMLHPDYRQRKTGVQLIQSNYYNVYLVDHFNKYARVEPVLKVGRKE
jgi:hypothetical protein